MFGLFAPQGPQMKPQELATRLAGETAPLVLDVREPAEYASGHIPGSRSMPLRTLPARLQELPRDRAIVVVCLSGGRSAQASRILLQAGYDALDMPGGMMAWRGPVER